METASIIHRDREVATGTFEEMAVKAAALVKRERQRKIVSKGKARPAAVYIMSGGRVYVHHGVFIAEVR